MNFMPYSFLAVNKISEEYESQERRFNYTTPKSFLELIALYKSMLANQRNKIEGNIKKLSDGVIKLESTAGTGHFYTTSKNRTNTPNKLEFKKYDPVVRKHVIYKETKLK